MMAGELLRLQIALLGQQGCQIRHRLAIRPFQPGQLQSEPRQLLFTQSNELAQIAQLQLQTLAGCLLLLAAFTVVGLAALTPAFLWEMAQGRSVQVSPGALAGIAYVGALPGFLGYVFYNRAVAEVGPGKASLFIHLMPVFGTLLAVIFLREPLLGFHFVALALVITGIAIAERGKL